MELPLTLIGHSLCPYAQRVAIALAEKRIVHSRRNIDLANKPDWFLEVSPFGRTPVLKVDETFIYESMAILDYLEETKPNPLHSEDPVVRAHHRAWMGFSSEVLSDIAGFYSAYDEAALEQRVASLHVSFALMEQQLGDGPWFDGDRFGLVDVCFGPVFRYFDTFEATVDFGFFSTLPRLRNWRALLAARHSVRHAVASDYAMELDRYLRRRGSELSRRIMAAAA